MTRGTNIKMMVDMSEVNKLIGAGLAVGGLTDRSRYVKTVINGAVPIALEEFDTRVTAFALASGGMKHMFEWGTLGINRGRSNKRPSPNSENARLWDSYMMTPKGQTIVSFRYKDSIADVPKPTKRDTGIDTDILKKLKTHKFPKKAMVLELGIPVVIKPKPGNKIKILFVPNTWKGEKGFTIYKRNTQPNISADTKGTFTIYWMTFWQGSGIEIIEREVESNVMKDVTKIMKKIQYGKQGTLKPLAMQSSNQQIEMNQKKFLRELEKAAAARLGNYEY